MLGQVLNHGRDGVVENGRGKFIRLTLKLIYGFAMSDLYDTVNAIISTYIIFSEWSEWKLVIKISSLFRHTAVVWISKMKLFASCSTLI